MGIGRLSDELPTRGPHNELTGLFNGLGRTKAGEEPHARAETTTNRAGALNGNTGTLLAWALEGSAIHLSQRILLHSSREHTRIERDRTTNSPRL